MFVFFLHRFLEIVELLESEVWLRVCLCVSLFATGLLALCCQYSPLWFHLPNVCQWIGFTRFVSCSKIYIINNYHLLLSEIIEQHLIL
jgi:hypothetical protein